MKHLIITADDFGLSESINEGIMKSYTEGVVTYLNIIPTGDAFEDAVRLAGESGLEEIGAHLTLTETRPITSIESNANHNQLFFRLLRGKISEKDIYIELKNQLDKIKKMGIKITNLSSHEHIHMMPGISEIFIRLAVEYAIPSVRYICCDRPASFLCAGDIYRKALIYYFSSKMKKSLSAAGIKHADRLFGFLDSGNMDEDKALELLKLQRDGTAELVCHPGFLGPEVLDKYRFHINCEKELYALTSNRVKDAVKELGIKLIKYSELVLR